MSGDDKNWSHYFYGHPYGRPDDSTPDEDYTCTHIWLQYIGLEWEAFEYCKHCDIRKLDWEESLRAGEGR